MRLLHTSDWHLGRSFHRVGMLSAQEAFLDHLIEVVQSERVDVLLVAGDVYDRALPGVDVVAVLDDALARLAATGVTTVLSSGNHDSARRLGFAARLLESARVHVRTDPARTAAPVLLDDAFGQVALYPLPYLEPALVHAGLGCARSHVAVLEQVMAGVRADLAGRGGIRSVVGAHAFVLGGLSSDSERDISVGGVGSVPSAVFDGVDYVALGHLHGRQQVGDGRIRYSGSPLAYSFSEAGQVKGSWLVELDRDGLHRVDPVAAPVPRPLALLTGRLEDLVTDPALAADEQAWCQVTLTDPHRPADAMQRLRARFPHTVELRFAPDRAEGAATGGYAEQLSGRDDLGVCCGFLEHVRGRLPDGEEVGLLRSALEQVRRSDPEEHGAAARRLLARAVDLTDRDVDLGEVPLVEAAG